MISAELREQLESELGPIASEKRLSGGYISSTAKIEATGGPAFLKVRSSAPVGFFEVERDGLAELAAAGAPVRIPQVFATGRVADAAFILMEWIEEEAADSHRRRLGSGLAALHRQRRTGWGWERDGFIGSLAQSNATAVTWSDFWLTRRLRPQLRLLRTPVGTNEEWSQLEKLLPDLLAPAEDDGPSLVHGDLWSANVMSTADGPALVDPACYRGHREVDLAMADLFGGFHADFFRSYTDAWPLLPGYEARKGVYQLYYLLVHVNLFGASYVSRTHHTLRRILGRA